ncbi:MAG: diacylglycerol kinase family lipid kinase [Alphaproteobacteria bacterium]|nr:diacylglycerol kinase family lipid kinase [Alphaproteobacteria bacterium]MBV9061696.1 diacylglycerol kinase family lipid kinase [Alphaproteobacteria bacterium]
MTAFVVVNPHSAGGRTGREWAIIAQELRDVYSDLKVAETRNRGQATALVRNALQGGYREIVAVGGDGTINEAINGFFDQERSIAPDAVFSFITSGTGGDFRKSFGIAPSWQAAVDRLKTRSATPVDVGRVSCLGALGTPLVRHFINIGSFGLSGAVVDSVNRARIAKLFGGKFAFGFHSALDMLTYRERAVRLRIDNGFDETVSVSTVAIANGQYFGGGMRVAPNAEPGDGVFEIVVMGGVPKSQAMAETKLLYTGTHIGRPHVRAFRGRKVTAAALPETKCRPVLIELDGENAGRLPATFDILPGALKLRC